MAKLKCKDTAALQRFIEDVYPNVIRRKNDRPRFTQLRLETGLIVNIYRTGTILFQGQDSNSARIDLNTVIDIINRQH